MNKQSFGDLWDYNKGPKISQCHRGKEKECGAEKVLK